MKNKISLLTACLDANVIISGIAFDGKPLEILDCALKRDFHLVTGQNILHEVQRNLVHKLGLKMKDVDRFLGDLLTVASVYVPSGKFHVTASKADDLVLEVAQLGSCDVLVTGDRHHLLPIKSFEGVAIEPPSVFLERLKTHQNSVTDEDR